MPCTVESATMISMPANSEPGAIGLDSVAAKDRGRDGDRRAERVTLLIPLLDDWDSVGQLLAELDRVAAAAGARYGVLLVDDGSLSPCPFRQGGLAWPHLQPVELLTLASNQGHTRAIAIGLAALAERPELDAVVVMDGDGEDRPADVPRLLERWRQHPESIVVAERRRRSEPLAFRLFYSFYKALFRLLTGRRIDFGNFCVLPARALQQLVNRSELWSHLAGTLIAGRWPITRLPTDRGKRYHGRSRMNLPALVQHGLGAVAVDLDRVLIRMLILLGVLIAALALTLLAIIGVKIFSSLAVPGWATTAFGLVAVLLLQSVVFAFLLLFVSLRTRGLPQVIPAQSWRSYLSREQPPVLLPGDAG